MSTTITEFVTLTVIHCGQCGGSYAINEAYRKLKYEEGKSWKCPYCQVSWGYAEGENTQLKRQLEEKSRALTAAKCETLNERNLREAAERKLLRTNRGVCTCCNRSFQNLGRHMKTKHPDFMVKK